MKKQLLLVSLLTVGTVLGAVSCGGGTAEAKYTGLAMADNDIYDITLGSFSDWTNLAKQTQNNTQRYMYYAMGEAALLDSATFVPTTTRGGYKQLTRAVYKTAPQVKFGLDQDRIDSIIVTNDLIPVACTNELKETYEKAKAGKGQYDFNTIKGIIEKHGLAIGNEYKSTFSTAPETWDMLNTSYAADADMISHGLVGLFEYDSFGQPQPRMCDRWDDGKISKVSEDGKTYTYRINKDNNKKWYYQDGTEYANVKAQDFVDGFHHMLDTDSGLQELVQGIIKGCSDYADIPDFSKVGVKATDDHTLVFELESAIPYFESMLTYSIFMPMNGTFFEAKGGKYGKDWNPECEYGSAYDKILYNGAFICNEVTANSKIGFKRNEKYFDKDNIHLNNVSYAYDDGSKLQEAYNNAKNGTYTGITLNATTETFAKNDGIYDTHAFAKDLEAVTYFGGFNLHRQTYKLSNGGVNSSKSWKQSALTAEAMLAKDFRKALSHAFDRATYNAISTGDDAKNTNLRNMYTAPDFVSAEEDLNWEDPSGFTFAIKKGDSYGSMVQKVLDKYYPGEINVADGQDGWYNPELAREYLQSAIDTLPANTFAEPIQIDVVYYSASTTQVAQAQAVKKSFEDVLTIDGKKYVQVNLVEATTTADYYASGYRAADGKSTNYDFFYGSGWGPDYGDPSTYLDTFAKETGYMNKVIGLY